MCNVCAHRRARLHVRRGTRARARTRLSPLRPDLLWKHTVRRHRCSRFTRAKAPTEMQRRRPARARRVHRAAERKRQPRGGLAGRDAPVLARPRYIGRTRPKYPLAEGLNAGDLVARIPEFYTLEFYPRVQSRLVSFSTRVFISKFCIAPLRSTERPRGIKET